MTAMDIIVIFLLGGGTILGFLRGFVHEVLALFAWVAGVVALKLFHGPATLAMADTVGTAAGAAALAFIVLFLPTYIVFKLLANRLGKRTRQSIVGPVDRLLGGGFGMIKGLLIATLLFLAGSFAYDSFYGADTPRPDWVRDSQTYSLLNATSLAVVDWVEEQRVIEGGLL